MCVHDISLVSLLLQSKKWFWQNDYNRLVIADTLDLVTCFLPYRILGAYYITVIFHGL